MASETGDDSNIKTQSLDIAKSPLVAMNVEEDFFAAAMRVAAATSNLDYDNFSYDDHGDFNIASFEEHRLKDVRRHFQLIFKNFYDTMSLPHCRQWYENESVLTLLYCLTN